MDKARAVQGFLQGIERVNRLPLITDDEMRLIFGEEVHQVMAEMHRFSEEQQLCARCPRRCCPTVHCELYAPEFSQCPIHDFRPPVCRLHFCHRFQDRFGAQMKDISDVFFDSLLTADRLGYRKAALFDSPPLGRGAPGLVRRVSPWVYGVREGSLDPAQVERWIAREAAGYIQPV